MKWMNTSCLATLAALAAAPLWAQASEEGAQELLALFQTYLGTTPGALSVTVDGDAYALTFDPSAMLTAIPVEGLTATVTPLAMQIIDQGDGLWAYEIDQPFSMAYTLAGQLDTKTDYESVRVSGTFDEALGDTSAYEIEVTNAKTVQTQTDPTMGDVSITNTIQNLSWSGSAAAGATGVDSEFATAATGITYDLQMPMGEGAPAMSIMGTIAGGTAEGTLTGYQPAAIYALLAWFVAHPDAALIEADKPGLKSVISAALPLFGTLSMTGEYTDIAVNSPVGQFGLASAGLDFEMNGVVADGYFREAIRLQGLTLPEGILPPFAAPLIPDELSIDLAASGFDLAAAADLVLSMLDLPTGAPPPEGFDAQMISALMPQGVVDLTLAPGGASNSTYALTYEGAMAAGPAGLPTGTAKVTLTGMEAILASLNSAPPEMSGQIVPMLGMAQAMGQPGAEGELVWQIDATTPGSLLINGMDMMGGQ